MNRSPEPPSVRVRWVRVAAALVAVAALAGVATDLLRASAPAPGAAVRDLLADNKFGDHGARIVADADHPTDGARRGPLGLDDGALPDRTTPFDDRFAGIARIDPALLGALRHAANDAAADGVTLLVESGWRSPAYQEQLRREAIAEHGSEQEAARWVADPERSAHVRGEAVDVAPASAADWLSAHGAAYGLCRIYANEAWHFELRPESVDRGCPPLYADASQDPRLAP